MTDYGDNTSVQVLAWGVANSDYDTKSSTARTVASDLIDSILNNVSRVSSPSSLLNSSANLLAAAILVSQPSELEKHAWYIQGMVIVKNMRGSQTTDGEWSYSYSVLRE